MASAEPVPRWTLKRVQGDEADQAVAPARVKPYFAVLRYAITLARSCASLSPAKLILVPGT